jgi:HEPN domain-containing protein
MEEWRTYLEPADAWFMTYASIPFGWGFRGVTLSCIGQTIELYLKAVVVKHTCKGVEQMIKEYGHDIKRLWDESKDLDKSFMLSYEIRDLVFNARLHEGNFGEKLKKLSERDQESYFRHSNFYFLAGVHLADLRYMGAPLPAGRVPPQTTYLHPDRYWIGFIKELRRYLGYPSPGELDWIKVNIDQGLLPPNATWYLQGLYA